MRFRLYSVVALLGATLPLAMLGQAQQPSSAPTHPAAQKAMPAQHQPMEKPTGAPVAPVMSGPYPVMSKAAEERGREIFEMFNHSQSAEMWAAMSENLRALTDKQAARVKKGLAGKEMYAEINKRMREQMGMETQLIEENIVPYLYAPDTVYSRLSMFGNVKVPVMSIVTLNQRGQIDAFDIKPMHTIAEGQYAGYVDQAKLKLPFNGEWLVYHGGRNIFQNPYAAADDSRFAMDFVYLQDGKLFSGAGGVGSKLEDYYCFGQPVLAPADGSVSRAKGGFDDVPPGKPTGDNPDGNIVIISHGNGESSIFTHLKQNSLKVKLGDKVKQGDVIGECGNSGMGGIPHIHYQFGRGRGAGLPAQFQDYIADGKPVASGEPTRGQFVKNGTASASMPAESGTAASSSMAPAKPAPASGTAASAKPASK